MRRNRLNKKQILFHNVPRSRLDKEVTKGLNNGSKKGEK